MCVTGVMGLIMSLLSPCQGDKRLRRQDRSSSISFSGPTRIYTIQPWPTLISYCPKSEHKQHRTLETFEVMVNSSMNDVVTQFVNCRKSSNVPSPSKKTKKSTFQNVDVFDIGMGWE